MVRFSLREKRLWVPIPRGELKTPDQEVRALVREDEQREEPEMEMSDDELKEILVYRPSQSIDLRIDDDSDPIWALALLAGLSFWGDRKSVV